jgi:hypothetical protein
MTEEKAETGPKKTGEKVKFMGRRNRDTEYFLNILVDELTKDVSLMVVDFADKDEADEATLLWEILT